MRLLKKEISPKIALNITLLSLVILSIIFQYISPTLYSIDGYYHIKLASLIRTNGFFRNFWWARFSVLANYFGDKDLTLHIIAMPFTCLGNLKLAAKVTVAFINILFLLSLAFVIRKYLSYPLTAIFIFLPFLIPYFLLYYVKLRPTNIVTIINILGITFLMEKKWKIVFLLSLIYPLSHISFPLIIFFAILCETVRYLYCKEFFLRNIYAAILGVSMGCVFHPYFPNNLLVFYLNAILVPFYMFLNKKIFFGVELLPINTKAVLFFNFCAIALLAITVWHKMINRLKLSFSTIFLFTVTNVYILMGCISTRFWYPADIFIIIFTASYLRDFLAHHKLKITPRKQRVLITLFICSVIVLWGFSALKFTQYLIVNTSRNTHYELVGKWMKKNIPPKETVYHAYFSDSPYFFFMNPKNRYILILDPIFMVYYNRGLYNIYRDITDGKYKNPHRLIKKYFDALYGYTRKDTNLYNMNIKNNPHFRILYEDEKGIIFKIKDKSNTNREKQKYKNEQSNK